MEKEFLSTEWQVLQKQSDQFELYSLTIKLIAIILLFVSFVFPAHLIAGVVFALLWLQDAILKTYQSRTEQRLIAIEHAFDNNSTNNAFQFNYPFSQMPRSTSGLVKEYIKQALRPTNAVIHFAVVVTFFVSQPIG